MQNITQWLFQRRHHTMRWHQIQWKYRPKPLLCQWNWAYAVVVKALREEFNLGTVQCFALTFFLWIVCLLVLWAQSTATGHTRANFPLVKGTVEKWPRPMEPLMRDYPDERASLFSRQFFQKQFPFLFPCTGPPLRKLRNPWKSKGGLEACPPPHPPPKKNAEI